MPIYSHDIPGTMRMNVSKLLLRNLALNVNHNYNLEKSDIADINDTMQYLEKNLSMSNTDYNHDETVKQVAITTAKVRRLPYPDHNYGQQPPLTPPSDDQRIESTRTKVRDEQEGTTNCICGFDHTDEYMICCDNCGCWEHIVCIGISVVPDKYHCHKCNPREFEIEKAKAIQEAKRKNMSINVELDEGDESVEENKTHYTAISNTPTRITFLSNSQSKSKNKKNASKVQKRKLSESISSRKKTKRKLETSGIEASIPTDRTAFMKYMSDHLKYEHIDLNIYHEDIANASFNWPETCHIDLKNAVVTCSLRNIDSNQKGLFASCEVSSGSFLIEYKGHLMFFKKFNEENPQLYYWCPFVITYHSIEHLELVIDSRKVGNEARFVRRSCSPNAKFQHLSINGLIRIVITSITNISKDQEITVPLDSSLESNKYFVDCCCGSKDCVLSKNKEITEKQADVESPIENDALSSEFVSKIDSETVDVDSEQYGEGNEKQLSREDKKIQAALKHFENMNKKSTTTKKVKEPKTSVSKNLLNAEESLKSSKKSTSKRKPTTVGKRRTRQSSCSSEPISPIDPNASCSGSSTPNASWSLTHVQNHFDQGSHIKKDKETLPFSLVMLHKQKHQQSDSSTPPNTPLIHLSPCKFSEISSLPLSVDTRTHCDGLPMKPGLSNGLLQIANSHSLPLTPNRSYLQSFGSVTAEEKIGDFSSRDEFSSKLDSPILPNKRSLWTNKYYGSLKRLIFTPKHWLNNRASFLKIMHQNESAKESFSQFSSINDNIQNASQCFKKPQSYIPLKQRLLSKSLNKQTSEVANVACTDDSLKTEKPKTNETIVLTETNNSNIHCAIREIPTGINSENQLTVSFNDSVSSVYNTEEKPLIDSVKLETNSETEQLGADNVSSSSSSFCLGDTLNKESQISIVNNSDAQHTADYKHLCYSYSDTQSNIQCEDNTINTDLRIVLSGAYNEKNDSSYNSEQYQPGIIQNSGSLEQTNDLISNNGGHDGLASGKKKLSYKEYRKRQRSQKLNSLPSDRNYNQSFNGQDIKSTSYMPIETETNAFFNLQNIPNYITLVSSSSSENTKNINNDDSQSNINEISQINNCSLFEPVSSGDDCESSPPETTHYDQTIHSDITKNPFNVHSNINKNVNKGNRQNHGLYHYPSSPKYSHGSYDNDDVDKHYRIHSDNTNEREENVRSHASMITSRGNLDNFQERYKTFHSYGQPNSRDYTRDFRDGYSKQSNSPHNYGNNLHIQSSANRPLQRSSALSPMNNFNIRSPQSSRNISTLSPQGSRNNRLSNGGYIPY